MDSFLLNPQRLAQFLVVVIIEETVKFINETQLLVRALKRSSCRVSIEDQGQQTKLKDVKKETRQIL